MLRTSVPREPILDSARQGLDVRISDIDISTEHSFLILFSPDICISISIIACNYIIYTRKLLKGKTKNSVKAGRLCHHLHRKGVIAMDNDYIICFMIILLLIVISIKK